MASQADRDELEKKALIQEQEEREREEGNMDCDLTDDLAVEDDVEVVVIETVEGECVREEEGSRDTIGGNSSEGNSEGGSEREGLEESESGKEEEGSRGKIGEKNMEKDSEGNSKRNCEKGSERKRAGEGKWRAQEEFDGVLKAERRSVNCMADVERDEKVDS